MNELKKIELRAQKDYEKLSKDIKELFTEKEYIELVKKKYVEIQLNEAMRVFIQLLGKIIESLVELSL